MYKNTPHVQISLMCRSQLHVEVWIPSHTEMSDFTYVWVSFTCSTQMILVTFFFGKWRGAVHIHVSSRTEISLTRKAQSHVDLTCGFCTQNSAKRNVIIQRYDII